MKIRSQFLTSFVIASGVLIGSLLYPFVPCKKFPNVPNPVSTYSLCTLNPDIASTLESKILYFGYTPYLTTAYFIILTSVFLISFGILTFLSKRRKK